jgi:hypothetical protein
MENFPETVFSEMSTNLELILIVTVLDASAVVLLSVGIRQMYLTLVSILWNSISAQKLFGQTFSFKFLTSSIQKQQMDIYFAEHYGQ